ncbi:MAG: HlyD family efflux transporter periplasmic adaptor subunit [Tissierellia bacterium]|nr:HlyD family efflux transporter periplasmic adaptor subunit [Tissierellia bacterium]MDD4725836.1 HlyD family efflux transporter periplasmic adaptor subunit [Tissierellia bacterium]
MGKIVKYIKSKGKIAIVPMIVVAVLVAIYIVNAIQTDDSAIFYAKDGTFLEASGMAENNSVSLSSELAGVISDVLVKEGDSIKEGEVIAEINNTTVKNQYEQALDNFKLAEKNLQVSQDSINSYKNVFADSTEQARSGYNSSQAEYEKVIDGASDEEIKQVQEAFNQAEINFKFVTDKYEESNILLENDIISQKDYEEIEKNYNLAQAQLNTASAKLDQVIAGPSSATIKAVENKVLQAKAAHELSISSGNMQLMQLENQSEIAELNFNKAQNVVNQLKEELGKTEIKSPINGVINLLPINKGEFTAMGKTVAEIFNTDNMEIIVYVSEANIGHVKTGQNVDLFVDSTDEIFKGKVIRVNNNAEFTPKNIATKEERVNIVFEVKIEVLDSKGVIKPGMPVDVNIKID